jgi:tetratricopeptide (TPR) repeat protein
VGEATRQAAAGAVAFESVGEQELKGKGSSVPAYRALRVVATVGGALRTESLEPPFVGRETEFRLLRELFHATPRERRARLVSLTGQAGIGKSRLAWEFQKYLDGIQQVIWWHHGRSPSYGEGVTFWALGEMIRKRAGLAEADDDETGRLRIHETVATHVADPGEQALVEPALLALLGLAEPPPGGRDRLFAGWRLFIERLSEASTVVLVFEDLQWADDGMLDFIEHLLEWSRSYPILIVTLARPELLDRRPTWGVAGRSTSSLALGALGDGDMRALLAGLVPGLPESAVRSILGRADGIPLYAVETVRMLISDGRLEPDGDGRFRPVGRLDAVEVPATLQALIGARLDALAAPDRALLQDASVLGQTFTIEALAAVHGTDTKDLEPRLRGLVALEVMALDTDPASPERGQYGFVQEVIREVAYGTLAKRDRRTRHLAAARYFEARGDEEFAPILASHYLNAYRAAPDGPEGEAIRGQARIALRAAAQRARALGSYGAATSYLEQAIELGSADAADEAELLERAGEAAALDGQYERAEGLLTRAVARWREAGDVVRIGQATAALGFALTSGGRGDQAIELLEAARAEFSGEEHVVARAPIVARLAHVFIRRGAGAAALAAAEEALPVAERHRMVELFYDVLITKGGALAQVGRDLEAGVLLAGALKGATEAGLVALQMRAMVNSVVRLIEENPLKALELGQETIEQSRRFGVRPNLVFAVLNTAEIAIRVGSWDEAETAIDSIWQLDLEPNDRSFLLTSSLMLASCRGRSVEALEAEHAAVSAELDRLHDPVESDVRALRAQLAGDYETARRIALEGADADDLNAPGYYERAGRAALWMGDLEGARADLAAFDALGRSVALPAAQVAGLRAGVLALEGRRDEAVAAYRDVARRYDELGAAFDGAVYRLDAAKMLGIDTPEGAAAAADARSVFERLDARPFLTILDGFSGTGESDGTREATRARETARA